MEVKELAKRNETRQRLEVLRCMSDEKLYSLLEANQEEVLRILEVLIERGNEVELDAVESCMINHDNLPRVYERRG